MPPITMKEAGDTLVAALLAATVLQTLERALFELARLWLPDTQPPATSRMPTGRPAEPLRRHRDPVRRFHG